MGLEGISRGIDQVIFENNYEVIEVFRKKLQKILRMVNIKFSIKIF